MKKLDFRFFAGNKKIGAPFHGLKAFFTTGQLNLLDKVTIACWHAIVCARHNRSRETRHRLDMSLMLCLIRSFNCCNSLSALPGTRPACILTI